MYTENPLAANRKTGAAAASDEQVLQKTFHRMWKTISFFY